MLLPKVLPTRKAIHRVVPHLTVLHRVAPRPGTAPRTLGAAPGDPWVNLGGVAVKLMEFQPAIEEILGRASDVNAPPLGVCSANLDHIRHFGSGGRWAGTLDQPGVEQSGALEWLTLIDGAPLATEARRLTSRSWPRLAGSDLVGPLLEEAERRGLTVGFLGGSVDTQRLIRDRFEVERPHLKIVGWWAPARTILGDPQASRRLAGMISESAPDVLIVGLGKPRQELWISEYGAMTGARVLLAFGAVVDFLAGHIKRAPSWVSSNSLEWAWRLALEPRRLARRYLVEGPEAYVRLRKDSGLSLPPVVPGQRLNPNAAPQGTAVHSVDVPERVPSRAPGSFLPASSTADVAVVVVTYNNEDSIGPLILSLRKEAREQSLKVVVADNSPNHGTISELSRHPDVISIRTGGNLGYAGGINAALSAAGEARTYLILNPDLRVEEGSIGAMRRRLLQSGAGMVVPVLMDDDGTVYPSLRREPGVLRALGDAALGSHVRSRPAWLSEMDFDEESYLHGHQVEWATGAALLVDAGAATLVGAWDERFFLYSEETDYCHRMREAGYSIWFEPAARMWHTRGGSGASPQLVALMSVNRVRYAEKYLGPARLVAFRGAVLAAEVARLGKAGHRDAAWALTSRRRWDRLPHAVRPVEREI
ncbi:WecB/TagA/CpsF family glycosyltransferase [Paenarthrobacter sp. NPDC057981]|uniref:WecB/TagA/CpsF family glycosyltransferase n=1 Tax=Paenarthrobacter sp. NPDC057981 TaxID=3346297 RepID=UPI0036DE2804